MKIAWTPDLTIAPQITNIAALAPKDERTSMNLTTDMILLQLLLELRLDEKI